MRLSPWQIFGPLALAVVVLAVVVLHQAAPESCGQADESYDKYLNQQAKELYTEILEEEPDSECAAMGMKRLVKRLCFRGKRLARHEATEQANKVFASLLEMEPPGRAVHCASRSPAKTPADQGGGDQGMARCKCTASCPGPRDDNQPASQNTDIDDRDVGILGLGVVLRVVVHRDEPAPDNGPRKVRPKPCPWPG
jgi:hypothetical protein